MADRELRDDKTALHQTRLKQRIRSGMNFIEGRPEDSDCPPSTLERFFMSGGVDSCGQAADDHDAALDQSADESFHPFPSGERRFSRAHDRNAGRRAKQRDIAAGEKLLRSVALFVFIEPAHNLRRIERHDLVWSNSRVLYCHVYEEFTPAIGRL